MDAFMIYIKHSCQEMNIYCLEDIATMKCVSKVIKTELEEIYQNQEDKNALSQNTIKQLGFVTINDLSKLTLLNRELYLQYMFQVTRYYNDQTMEKIQKRDKLVLFLNEFTLHNSMKIFTNFSNVTIDEQANTVSELLKFADVENKNMADKILAIYLIYYFVSKLYKRNGKRFLKDRNKCILGCNNFRTTCVLKANETIQSLKKEITMFPYIFIDKVIRLLQQTSRNIANL